MCPIRYHNPNYINIHACVTYKYPTTLHRSSSDVINILEIYSLGIFEKTRW